MPKVRILFVDDERSILDGLRRMLRKQAGQWEMEFVDSAAEALQKLSAASFDILVTDMKMPEMDGAELLEQVRQRWPDLGRIVLSGHADEAMAVRATRVAHQYLAKPTDPETLKDAITRVKPECGPSSNERVRAVVGKCHQLPGLPTLCAELAQVLESEQANAKMVAGVISRDPAMTAKILQLVNSSFFGIGRRVSSIETAVSLLGTMRIRGLVFREQIFKSFVLSRPIKYFSVEALGHRSLQVAELARMISKTEGQGGDRPDQAFTAGLLHDVGLLLLACYSEEFPAVMQIVHDRRVPISEAEMEILEVTHAEMGSHLLGLWGLPPRIVEAVAFHHEPLKVSYEGVCAVTAVHVADALLAQLREPSGPESLGSFISSELCMEYVQRLGLEHRLADWKACALEVTRRAAEQPEAVCT
jgi:HD-like signal output (HDOD) protein/ActR/RegA family two-component response regulator